MRPSNCLILSSSGGSASFVSSVVYAWDIVRCSYQATLALNVNGTLALQGSNDVPVGQTQHDFIPTNWNTVSSASVVTCSVTTATCVMIPAQEVCYRWLRVAFTNGHAEAGGAVVVRFNSFGL